MSCQIPQHIYTSTGRINFETVAVSPGVPPEIVKQLEARAQSYPNRRQWGEDPPVPPFVVRGFRIGEQDYGIGLLLYIGESLSRAEGNYICHSYVIPHELLEQQDYNLPWIAANLPINFGYYPAKGSGKDELPPLEFDLDPARQLTMFRFAAREMGEAGLRALVNDLIVSAESGKGQALELPTPHKGLGSIFHEVLGLPPEAAPPQPDALRLLRLAGAIAILPSAFKQSLTFTINDNAPQASDANTEGYAVRVARTDRDSNSVSPGRAYWPWFDYCVRLAEDGQLDKLQEMCAWLSKLLPGGVPSRKALDAGFKFYRDLVAGDRSGVSHHPARQRDLISRIASFEGCAVDADALYQTLWPHLQHQGMRYEERCSFFAALSRLNAKTGKPLPDRVFLGVMDCLKTEPGNDTRQQFWKELPEVTQAQIWEQSFLSGVPPGRIPTVKGTPDPDHLSFMLRSFKPGLMRGNSNREAVSRDIIRNLVNLLQHQVRLPQDFYTGKRPDTLNSFLRLFWALINLTEADERLWPELVTSLTALFFQSLTKSEYKEELCMVVTGALRHATGLGTRVLAEFTRQAIIHDEMAVLMLLFNLPFDPQRRRQTRDFIHTLDRYLSSIRQRQFLRVLEELADTLDRPERCDPGQPTESVLPRFVEWQKETKNRRSDDGTLKAFQEQLRSALQHLQAVSRFNVGVTYLFLSSPSSVMLFDDLMALLNKSGDKIAHWCLADWQRVPERVRPLGRFLRVANEIGSKEVDRALVQVVNVVYALNSDDQRCKLLLQLDHYLAETEVPRAVKQTLQGHLKRLTPAQE